ncbi:DUF4058 family protein [Paludisphaera mucosa]|uniref:DUF4058 family protein n=1 Tax=Paludisphaera mucosa TaxID=3030827 RepID=UPI0034A5480B
MPKVETPGAAGSDRDQRRLATAPLSRQEPRPVVDFQPVGLHDRPPILPVPLRSPDAETQFASQEALDQVYDEASYAQFLNGAVPSRRHPPGMRRGRGRSCRSRSEGSVGVRIPRRGGP